MSLWFILALAAPVLWAFNIAADSAIRNHFIKNDVTMTWFTAVLHAVAVIPFFIFVDIGFESYFYAVIMVVAGTLWTVPFLIYYRAMEFEESSRTAILLQMGPIWALVVAYIFLGEGLSGFQAIAFILLLIGGVLAALKKVEGVFHFSKAFWLILLTTLIWSFSDVFFKMLEPKFNSFYSAFTFFFLGSAVPALVMLYSARLRKSIKKTFKNVSAKIWLFFIIGHIFDILGSFIFAYAIILGSVALTTVITGIEPLLVFVLTMLFRVFIKEIPKEDLSRSGAVVKVVSMILILGGLVLLNV